MDDKNVIGQRIKAAREKKKISQEELGRRLGVSFQSVQQWESGRTAPRTARVRKLATVLETSPHWLQFGMGDEQRQPFNDIAQFVRSEDFKNQVCTAHAKAVQLMIQMGWLSIKRNDITHAIMSDVFFTKLLEEYGMEPHADAHPAGVGTTPDDSRNTG